MNLKVLFRKIRSWKHLLPLGVVLILVVGVYWVTMPPGITWEHFGYDAGDLISCVYTWGIPHPPGTPLYVLVGQIFRYLPFFPNPAARFNFMSAVFGWGSIIFLYLASFNLTGSKFAAVAAALFFSFAPLIWGQSIIAEVLTLNLFLVALSTYLLLVWERSALEKNRRDKFLYAAVFFFALAFTNHTSVITLAPAILFLILAVERSILLQPGKIVKLAAVALLGLLPYLYLPIRAAADPVLNWGDPDTLPRFLNHVLAKEYQDFLFVAPVLFLDNATRFLLLTWKNFNPVGTVLVALGFAFGRKDRFRDFLIFTVLFQLLFIFNYNIVNIETYLLPVFFALALVLSEGVLVVRVLFRKAADWVSAKNLRPFARIKPFWGSCTLEISFSALTFFVLSSLLVGASLVNISLRWEEIDLTNEREAYNFGRSVFEVVEPGALVLADGDEFFLGLTYFNHVLFPEKDVAVLHVGLFYKLNWMLKQARRNYPYLKYPLEKPAQSQEEAEKALLDFVAMNMEERPVYLAVGEKPLKETRSSRTTWGDRFIVQGEGPIYKVVGEKEGTGD